MAHLSVYHMGTQPTKQQQCNLSQRQPLLAAVWTQLGWREKKEFIRKNRIRNNSMQMIQSYVECHSSQCIILVYYKVYIFCHSCLYYGVQKSSLINNRRHPSYIILNSFFFKMKNSVLFCSANSWVSDSAGLDGKKREPI